MNDSELLKYIKKLIEEKSETLQDRSAWQEHIDRHTTVNAKSIQASEIIRGFSGSWASVYSNLPSDERLEKIADQRTPPNPSKEFTKIGQAGIPEINFAPYDHNTNRKGLKGTSLLGHPISFEVVGTTVKSSACDWQFIAEDNSSIPSAGDTLRIDIESSLLNPSGIINPTCMDFIRAYNIDNANPIPNGGLYIVVSHTGEPPPAIDGVNESGLGDGTIANEGVAPTTMPGKLRKAVTAKDPYSKYEIFRVVGIDPDTPGGLLTLDASKRLKDYFNFESEKANIIRSITIIKPKVTRLVTIPGTGSVVGNERAFVVVPPEKSAISDLTPPLNGQTVGDKTWVQGGFDPNDPALVGDSVHYEDTNNLPIPRVLGKYVATLEKATQGLPKTAKVSRLFGNFSSEIQAGQIVHIFKKQTEIALDIPLTSDPFGWYEIIAKTSTELLIKKVVEVNPETGVKNYQPIIVRDDLDASYTGKTYTVHFHLHDPISALFTKHFDIDAVESARLDNLIDPTWVEESGKNQESKQHTLYSKSDRSIFDTTSKNNGLNLTNADPGSLLDLGFRMVLFPAKNIAGLIIPDFDKPINSRECLINSTIEDQDQSIHIDYSSGVVLLSHEPKWKTSLTGIVGYHPCDVNPNHVTDADGRLVLFASCVPYSREQGQLGSAVRVTASTVDFSNDLEEQCDIYGKRISFDIQAGQTVLSQTYNAQLILSRKDSENILPETGYIEILHSATTLNLSNHPAFTVLDGGGVTRRVSTFLYHDKTVVTSGGVQYTALVGVIGGSTNGTNITSTYDGEYKIVLRKNVRPMCNLQGVCGVPYQEDTTHGSAKRFGTIRFKNSDLVQNKDGSVTIDVGTTPTEVPVGEDVLALEGEFVLLPKGPTSSKGSGESRYFSGTLNVPTIVNLGEYPTDTPLYEFSGGYGQGFLHRGYPIKPSGYFNNPHFSIPPTTDNYWDDTTYNPSSSLLKEELPFNSIVSSGNLSVGYRHINSRESYLYSSMSRQNHQFAVTHRKQYRNQAKRQMRVLDGMVIEDVTNGTFYNVGSKGQVSLEGYLPVTTFTINNTVNIMDGDTFYLSSDAVTKVEYTFRNTPDPAIPEEVLIGADTYQTMCNLMLQVNNQSSSATNKNTLNIERFRDVFLLKAYFESRPTGSAPTVVGGYGDVYNNPADFTGLAGVGGSIAGAPTGTTNAPLMAYEVSEVNKGEACNVSFYTITDSYLPNYLISSGDRASLFWTFYDDLSGPTINTKDELWIGFLHYDNVTVSALEFALPNPATGTLFQRITAIVDAINNTPKADYIAAGFPDLDYYVEARLCHKEENGVYNRYAIEIRSEVVGDIGNRFFIPGPPNSNLGQVDGMTSLVSSTFNHAEVCDITSTTWTTHANPGGGDYNRWELSNGQEVWFLEGGVECEINYDINDNYNLHRLPNQSGLGDRSENDIPRKPLAGHHYRVIANTEFVRVLGYKGVHGGLLPPYTDPDDPSTIISNAHAIFFDPRYDFQGEDVGKKFYLSGTDTYAYVGWWEILGILPNFVAPHNVLDSNPMTVAIVKKIGIETRNSSNDERIYNQVIPTQRGQLPLTYRSPIVRMGVDVNTNGQSGLFNHEPFGFFGYFDKSVPNDATYSELVLTIQLANQGTADKVQQFTVFKNELATGTIFMGAPNPYYVVDSAFKLAEFCNADLRMNGYQFVFSDGSTGVQFIKWVVEVDADYPSGSALYVTYNLTGLTQTQKDTLLGKDGILQVNFLSRQDGLFFKDDTVTYGPPIGLNDPTAIGFISYPGHNSEFDTCIGDRNSTFSINPFQMIDAVSNPGVVPSADVSKVSKSACNGLRWVFSEPLEDRHNGSYVHIKRENEFIFTGYNWYHHLSKVNDLSEHPTILYQDTFRINKCPATKQFLLGGDVEVFHTEVNGIINESYSPTVPIYQHPIAYSSLGVMGVWNDTVTNALPNTGSSNYSPSYRLQLVNKERIVTISPTNMASNVLLGTTVGGQDAGTGGLGTRVITNTTPRMTLGAETPFKLFSKSNIQRSNMWGLQSLGNPLTTDKDETRAERELWNSDNPFGQDLQRVPLAIPYYYYSLYSWSPNNAWWQTQMPVIMENDQINASTPPPTLRIDLTEQFTQSLTDGNGNTLKDGGFNAKGIRLNKLWVNFGVWGDYIDVAYNGSKFSVAGAPDSLLSLQSVINKPATLEGQMISHNHISFNLVLELPSIQKNAINLQKQRGVVSVIGTFPEADLGTGVMRLSYGTPTLTNLDFTAVSLNDATGVANTFTDYDCVVGEYVWDGAAWVWTPFEPYKLARSISDAINRVYKNSDLTPSAEFSTVKAHALYDKIYYEGFVQDTNDPNFRLFFYGSTVFLSEIYHPYSGAKFTSTGADSILFGDRGGTATPTHMMNVDTIQPIRTVVIPLYVNRQAGEVMPNSMEMQVDMGVGKYSLRGQSIPADWSNGDPVYGFGYSDFPSYDYLNGLSYCAGVVLSPYQEKITHNFHYSKNKLIGNPISPVVWGGIDFDSANNNYIQKTTNSISDNIRDAAISVRNDTYNGHNGLFTSPFTHTAQSGVQASQHPRLSRLGGGLRAEYSTGQMLNGDQFQRGSSRYPFEGPTSLNANAMTGIVVCHIAQHPQSTYIKEGSIDGVTTPNIGTDPIRKRGALSCGHAFTVSLTPMPQKFEFPTDTTGVRSSVGTALQTRINNQVTDNSRLSDFGRHLDFDNNQNQVGNWLSEVLDWAGVENKDGSSLPQGARVYLEVATNIGGIDNGLSNNGVWVGSVKCSFDVEHDSGTTQTKIINEE